MMRASVFGAATHRGNVRSNNEDNYLVLNSKDEQIVLAIIADGMGGHLCGEEASELAVRYSSYIIDRKFNKSMSDAEILDVLDTAIETANIHVDVESKSFSEKKGMGTTLTIGLLHNNKIYIGHVGDSRIYLLRDDEFFQLTKDDTYVQSLVDKGEIAPEEAIDHPQNNILMKSVGSGKPVKPQLLQYNLKNNDKLVFCTDGLYDAVPLVEIKNYLTNNEDPQVCAEQLVEETLRRGAPDNVSVITCYI